ncbi:DUF6527 family protein [Mesorhizobium sp. M1295]|uniref:DUF6527 family protein n=1 Tax=Mesorhizobium sp. M1295 TaxID=2957076 RepID=UPI00333DA578
MSRARYTSFKGEAQGHAQAVALLHQPGDMALDRRGVPRSLVMLCPDGCGDTLSVNLDARAGKAWRVDVRKNQLTLYPSVWRDQGCGAHFIVWRDRLLWCDRYDPAPWRDDELVGEVYVELERSVSGDYRHYEHVATILDAIPWEVLWACQMLTRQGRVDAKQGGLFRLRLGSGGTTTPPESQV